MSDHGQRGPWIVRVRERSVAGQTRVGILQWKDERLDRRGALSVILLSDLNARHSALFAYYNPGYIVTHVRGNYTMKLTTLKAGEITEVFRLALTRKLDPSGTAVVRPSLTGYVDALATQPDMATLATVGVEALRGALPFDAAVLVMEALLAGAPKNSKLETAAKLLLLKVKNAEKTWGSIPLREQLAPKPGEYKQLEHTGVLSVQFALMTTDNLHDANHVVWEDVDGMHFPDMGSVRRRFDETLEEAEPSDWFARVRSLLLEAGGEKAEEK